MQFRVNTRRRFNDASETSETLYQLTILLAHSKIVTSYIRYSNTNRLNRVPHSAHNVMTTSSPLIIIIIIIILLEIIYKLLKITVIQVSIIIIFMFNIH
jgi:uncharacterized membrane protein YhdT